MKKLFLFGMVLFTCTLTNAVDYKSALMGKTLRMDGASCAGISLKKQTGLISEQPMSSCSLDTPAKLRWLSNDTFMLVESNKTNNTSPPRTYISKIKSIKGDKAVIAEVWTGWGDYPDEDVIYRIEK